MNAFIGTGPFPPIYWLFLILWIPSLLLIDEFAKAIIRRRDARRGGI
jgi:hypothetical protein